MTLEDSFGSQRALGMTWPPEGPFTAATLAYDVAEQAARRAGLAVEAAGGAAMVGDTGGTAAPDMTAWVPIFAASGVFPALTARLWRLLSDARLYWAAPGVWCIDEAAFDLPKGMCWAAKCPFMKGMIAASSSAGAACSRSCRQPARQPLKRRGSGRSGVRGCLEGQDYWPCADASAAAAAAGAAAGAAAAA